MQPLQAIYLIIILDFLRFYFLKARLKCVEFHPSARVMLTAGLSQTLTLFQVFFIQIEKIFFWLKPNNEMI
jgi:hypothetical protein